MSSGPAATYKEGERNAMADGLSCWAYPGGLGDYSTFDGSEADAPGVLRWETSQGQRESVE